MRCLEGLPRTLLLKLLFRIEDSSIQFSTLTASIRNICTQ